MFQLFMVREQLSFKLSGMTKELPNDNYHCREIEIRNKFLGCNKIVQIIHPL